MTTSKQASKPSCTHCALRSHASVGLAQVHPKLVALPWTANWMRCCAPLKQLTSCSPSCTANEIGRSAPLTQLTVCLVASLP